MSYYIKIPTKEVINSFINLNRICLQKRYENIFENDANNGLLKILLMVFLKKMSNQSMKI